MAKIYSVVPIELRPGVRGEDFERFWIEEYAPLGAKLGWIGHVAKGDRGERTGKYAVIWEVPSIESRQRYSPAPGEVSQELLDLLGPDFDSAGQKLNVFIEGWPFTDYVEVGK
jgi:hypothetical protein